MIVALTGYARSGKDTVGQILVAEHGFRRVAFGDVLKAVAEDLADSVSLGVVYDGLRYNTTLKALLDTYGHDWEKVKDEAPEARKFLVDLGNSLRRRIPGVEVDAAFAGMEDGEDVVNTNVYHPEEIDRIIDMGGLVFRVLRPGHGPANNDEARTGCHPVSGEIRNNGTVEDLKAQVADLVKQLREVPF